MRSVTSVADVADVDRYPVDRLDSPAGQDLVARCRRELAVAGASVLEGFIRPAAVAAVAGWTMLAMLAMLAMPKAYRTEAEHNVYFTEDDPGLPAGDPHHIRVRSAKSALTYDQIPAGSPLRIAYESAELTAFAGAALGRDAVYRHADKLGATPHQRRALLRACPRRTAERLHQAALLRTDQLTVSRQDLPARRPGSTTSA